MTASRLRAVAYIPTIGYETIAFYVPAPNAPTWTWTLFVKPFNLNLWMFLLLFAFICSIILQVCLFYFHSCLSNPSFTEVCWYRWMLNYRNTVLLFGSSYFGKYIPAELTHFKLKAGIRNGVLLSIFLGGSTFFIGYRASLTSELSVSILQVPFTTPKQLANLDHFNVISSQELNTGMINEFFRGAAVSSPFQRI